MKRLLTMVLVLTMLTACAAPPAANPYEAEDFAYDGNYLTCTAGQSRLGVDVSSHQGDIDWDAVAAAGVVAGKQTRIMKNRNLKPALKRTIK